MEHCEKRVYANDKHCGECGDQLTNKPKILSVNDFCADAIAELSLHYPNITTITGRIKSTYLYKRRIKNKYKDLSYHYCFVEIEDNLGEVHGANVDVSGFFSDIKVGEVYTFVYPLDYSLGYEIVGKEAQQKVWTDSSVTAAIFHGKQQQSSYISKYYTPERQVGKETGKTAALMFVLTFLPFIYLFIFELNLKKWGFAIAIGASALIGAAIWLNSLSRANSKYNKALLTEQALIKTMEVLRQVSRTQLGFELVKREPNESDVFCSQCKERIPCDLKYCSLCGEQQKKSVEYTLKLKEQEPVSFVRPRSVSEHKEELYKQFNMAYETRYRHKHVLAFDEKGLIYGDCIFGQVLDKNLNFSGVFTTHSQIVKTTTHVGGGFTKSDIKTYNTFNERTSNLKGSIILKRADNEIIEIPVTESVASNTDSGDWIFLGIMWANINKENPYIEYGINLSKEVKFKTNSFDQYGLYKGVETWFYLLVITLITNIFFNWRDWHNVAKYLEVTEAFDKFPSLFVINNLLLVIFGGLTVFWLGLTALFGLINASRKRKALVKLRVFIEGFRKKQAGLLSTLKKLG